MLKTILSISIGVLLLLALPQQSVAAPFVDVVETSMQDVTISMNESVLHVCGANSQVMQIFNVAGVCVMSVKVDGPDKKYELNFAKGCYIVKVGKTVRKISVR